MKENKKSLSFVEVAAVISKFKDLSAKQTNTIKGMHIFRIAEFSATFAVYQYGDNTIDKLQRKRRRYCQ